MTTNPKQTAANQQPGKMSEQTKNPQQARTGSSSAPSQPSSKQNQPRDKSSY